MPKTSRGTSMRMSCLTITWQARRSPAAASRLLIWEVSVGRIAPPPSKTLTLHWPQVPPPPQAEATNSLVSARALRSFFPTGLWMVFSSLMRMFTCPVATSLERATTMMNTSAITMSVKSSTPRPMTSILLPR